MSGFRLCIAAAMAVLAAEPNPAAAQNVFELPGMMLGCRALTDNAKRLECYDAIGKSTNGPDQPAARPWDIKRSRAPLDDSQQFEARLFSVDGQQGLIVRCQERSLEVILVGPGFLGIEDRVSVTYRIDADPPIRESWGGITTHRGAAIDGLKASEFIKKLRPGKKLFARLTVKNVQSDVTLDLAEIAAMADEAIAACSTVRP